MTYLNDATRLFGLLQRKGLITEAQRQLVEGKKEQQLQQLAKGGRAGRGGSRKRQAGDLPTLLDVIVSLGIELAGRPGKLLSEEMIMRAIAADLQLPFKKLDPLELDLEVVTKTIPKSFALNHLLLPFAVRNGVLAVALSDPDKLEVLEDIERANQVTVKPYLSTRSDILKILGEFFGFQSSISAAESHLANPLADLGNLEQYVRISSTSEIASSDQHIKSAVDHLFNYAFEQRASDIHIEPKRHTSHVRLRIDGVLHSVYKLPRVVHSAMISRIKSLSRLDIAEKRRPQDGRIKIDREGKEAEIRVSTVPVAFGEKAVLRILDPDILFQSVDGIGLSERDLDVYRSFLQAPHGIVLVTGPTGSGKSTTLYSTLRAIATPEKNIITVEDPVEMVHEEFNQISVQPQVEVTFATILRSILRQDPDIIMIGEIRDLETAAHAAQAALTGHLVFSTLHTNDAVAAVNRLLDLGLQPFLVASALLGVVAQRLVRTICPHCSEEFPVAADTLRGFGLPVEEVGEIVLRRGKGCRQCRNTGYLGRCAVFEVFPMSEPVRQLIADGCTEGELRRVAVGEGMTTLRQDVWRKVKAGVTTHEEALRVIGGI